MVSLIDWSDPEEMLGLLVEYVADEARTARGDAARVAFLDALLEGLESVGDAGLEAADELVRALAKVRGSQHGEFAGDPVMDHLDGCMEELRRIAHERRMRP